MLGYYSQSLAEAGETTSSKEQWAVTAARVKASETRATSVASKAQPAEAAAPTAAAEAQAAEASVAAAQASVVAAAMAHGVRFAAQDQVLSVDVSSCGGTLIYPGQNTWLSM